jgi:hypothetical protein
MATPPYQQPANVAGQYQALGQAARGVAKGVSLTYDAIKTELNNKESIQKMVDSLNDIGIKEERQPGEDAETFGKRAAGKWAVYQTVANWKERNPSIMSPDMKTLTRGITNFNQGKTRADALNKQFEKQEKQAQEKQRGVATQKGLEAVTPQMETETERAKAFSGAAGPGIEPGFLGKTAIKEGLSPQEAATDVRAGQSRQFRITKEMETRKNRALQNYEHLLATNPKQAQQELQTYYAYDRMLKEGILPPDETKIASWAEKYMKQSDKQDQKGLDAQMLQAQAMKDPMVKRFGQSAMKSSIEKLLPGSPFKTIDDFYQALGQPNPFAETPAEPEPEGPSIGERVKKGAELWKQGIGTILGGGKEQPKQGAGRFKVKVKK